MHFGYPFHVDRRYRTASASEDDHVRDLIEQVLFTNPGERVNRPDFGSGLAQLVFGASSEAVATAAQSAVQGALQQWLGDRIRFESVEVESDDNRLRITVRYQLIRSQERRAAVFERRTGL